MVREGINPTDEIQGNLYKAVKLKGDTQDGTDSRLVSKTKRIRMIGYIYGIMNKLNGKWYVGQTTRPYQIRWLEHREHLQNREHHSYKLQRAFDECGIDAFEWHVLEEVEEDPLVEASVLLTRREQSWCAKKMGVKEGYNVLMPGKKYVSPEQKRKNRETAWKTKPKKKRSKKPPQKKSKKIKGSAASAKAKSLSNKWKKMDGCF